MVRLYQHAPSLRREILFQVILHSLVFLFFSFDKDQPQIKQYHFAFFLNYAFAAFVINYFLLPHFFYRKNTWSSSDC